MWWKRRGCGCPRGSRPWWLCNLLGLVGLGLAIGPVSASIEEEFLPHQEPVVGVYYYPWFRGEPFEQVGLTPVRAFNNVDDDRDIQSVLTRITEYGINFAAVSYWDNEKSLEIFQRTLAQAEKLRDSGRVLFLAPYLEPPTLDKRFADLDAIQNNIRFLRGYLQSTKASPCLARMGDRFLTPIYVASYQPTANAEAWGTFLKKKYPDLEALSQALGRKVEDWAQVASIPPQPGSLEHALCQEYREQALVDGVQAFRKSVRSENGQEPVCIGDCSSSVVSPRAYMKAMGGLTWYSFGQAIVQPFAKPKIESEIAKSENAHFFYTLAPGYVDTQQRWEGGRIEGEPFLYPYAWTHALCTLPEGLMILTHSEWFEGSVIDESKEYGKSRLETTELYASVFKSTFQDAYAQKRKTHEICVILNERVPYRLNASGQGMDDVTGWVELLGALSQEFDVLPETTLSREALSGRKLAIVPACRQGLSLEAREILMAWLQETPDAVLVATRSPQWAEAVGVTLGPEASSDPVMFQEETIELTSGKNRILEENEAQVTVRDAVGEPWVLQKTFPSGSKLWYINAVLGEDLNNAFFSFARHQTVPESMFQFCESLLSVALSGRYSRPSSSLRIKRGPCLQVPGGLIVPLVNVVPWGYLVEGRLVGWGEGKGHSAQDTIPWVREWVSADVPLPSGQRPVMVTVLDSDSGRMTPLEFENTATGSRFRMPVFFHALVHISTFPVTLSGDPILIHPGEEVACKIRLKNTTEKDMSEVKIALLSSPGLSMQEKICALKAHEETEVEGLFKARADFETGQRTVRFLLTVGEEQGLMWHGVQCEPEAILKSRTTVIAGKEGSGLEPTITLVNRGQGPAENIQADLAGSTASLPRLDPGQEATLRFSLPDPGTAQDSPLEITRVPLTITYAAYGVSKVEECSVRRIRVKTGAEIPAAPANPEARSLLVVDPFPGPHPGSLPLQIRFGQPVLSGVNMHRVTGWQDGKRIPASAIEAQVSVSVSMKDGVGLVVLGESKPEEEAQEGEDQIVCERMGRDPDALLSLNNGPLTLTWDARRGGNLVSLVSKETGQDLLAYPSGGVRFAYVSREKRDFCKLRGQVRLEAISPSMARVSTSCEDDLFQVKDVWEVWAGVPYVSLERTVTPRGDATLDEVFLLSVQGPGELLDRVMPNGVGFVDPQGRKRGWFETWAIPAGLWAWAGDRQAPSVSLGLGLLTPEAIERVRYGFFDQTLGLHCMGPTFWKKGIPVRVRGVIMAGPGGEYSFPGAIARVLKDGVLTVPLEEIASLGGPQVSGDER